MRDADREKKLALQRWEHDVRRREKKKAREVASQQSDSTHHGYKSALLNYFGQDFEAYKKRRKSGPLSIRLPSKFSLTTNPEETLLSILRVVKYARTARRPRLIIDHRNIVELGLGAEAVLAVVLKEISMENQSFRGSYIRGYKPRNPKLSKIMDEIGCVRVLRTGADEDIKISLRSTAKVFRHQNRGHHKEVDALVADPISITTREFSDHLDSCLSLVAKKLSQKGRERILAYVAEVLINAQEHSGSAEWTIVGFVDQEDEGLIYRAAIFSIGRTISETFKLLDKDSYSWGIVEPYLNKHKLSGFFRKSWCEDDLLAIIALQGNISSKLEGPESDRGQGTVDLIEFFQEVSGECTSSSVRPKMSIMSGATHIIFGGEYKMNYESDIGRMVIAFNKENNLYFPPDSNVVKSLDGIAFPGALISIAIPLAEGTVEQISEAEDEY